MVGRAEAFVVAGLGGVLMTTPGGALRAGGRYAYQAGGLTLLLMPLWALAYVWPGTLAAVLAGTAMVRGYAGLTFFAVAWDAALQDHIPHQVLARVSSWDLLTSFLAMPIGNALAGPLSAAYGTNRVLVVCAAVLLARRVDVRVCGPALHAAAHPPYRTGRPGRRAAAGRLTDPTEPPAEEGHRSPEKPGRAGRGRRPGGVHADDPAAGEERARARVLAAYDGYQRAQQAALLTADEEVAGLARFGAEPLLSQTRASIRQMRAAGVVGKGTQRWSPRVVELRPTSATIEDCTDIAQLDGGLGHEPATGCHRRRSSRSGSSSTSTAKLLGGEWSIVGTDGDWSRLC